MCNEDLWGNGRSWVCVLPCAVPAAPGRLVEYMSAEDLGCGCVGARAENLLFLDINRALDIRKHFLAWNRKKDYFTGTFSLVVCCDLSSLLKAA